MHVAYRQSGSLADVREFFAELVAIVRGEPAGAWQLVARTPLPHEWHGALEVLARTEWRLGEAVLVQSVAGGDGNPRDGHGFDVSLELSLPGRDGGPRRVSIVGSAWEPLLNQLCFTLAGFSAGEFLQARAAGVARFKSDDTANVVWAAHNVEELLALGERGVARELAAEGLRRPAPAWARATEQSLRRTLLALTEEPDARALVERDLLLADTTEYARLGRIAGGAQRLPPWTPEGAARALAIMRPWEHSSASRLGELAARWFDHPWWRPARARALGPWSSLRTQLLDSRREGQRWIRTPRGEPGPYASVQAVHLVRQALGLGDVDVSIRKQPDGGQHLGEGFVVGLDGEVPCVRAVVHHHERDEAFEHRWTWLWTGVGLEGAVVVTRLAAPTVAPSEWAPVDNHVTWLGSEAVAARSAQALLEQNIDARLGPA